MFTAEIFASRRQKLLDWMEEDSIAVIFSAPERIRNADTHYQYRPDSNFFYLTGFCEPEAIAVLVPNRESGEYLLFNRPKDLTKEIWDGHRAGQEGAVAEYLADEAHDIAEINSYMLDLLVGKKKLYACFDNDSAATQIVFSWLQKVLQRVRGGVQAPESITDIKAQLSAMRLIKDASELEVMRYVAEASAKAHIKAMQHCRPGQFEYNLEAVLAAELTHHGCRQLAYPMIIGAGKHACILHYIANNAEIIDGDLVLIDAGGEYLNYAADITRTFPANGKFSPEQKAIYELVLEAQLAGIAAVAPGKPWNLVQEVIVAILTRGLVELGLLSGEVESLIAQEAYQQFYMHKSGHWLGLDVHDVGKYKQGEDWQCFAPGMVLTVEPGIYIAQDAEVAEQWRGIGVRIEDDILVTEQGCEVLSATVPKTVAEIEAIMAHVAS